MPTLKLQTTEADFMAQVIDLAHLYGWLVQHTRPAWTEKGYRTPIQGDAGFLDLVLAHLGQQRVIFAEAKSQRGRLSPAQQRWIEALKACGQEVEVWRPDDINRITWLLQPQDHRRKLQEDK